MLVDVLAEILAVANLVCALKARVTVSTVKVQLMAPAAMFAAENRSLYRRNLSMYTVSVISDELGEAQHGERNALSLLKLQGLVA